MISHSMHMAAVAPSHGAVGMPRHSEVQVFDPENGGWESIFRFGAHSVSIGETGTAMLVGRENWEDTGGPPGDRHRGLLASPIEERRSDGVRQPPSRPYVATTLTGEGVDREVLYSGQDRAGRPDFCVDGSRCAAVRLERYPRRTPRPCRVRARMQMQMRMRIGPGPGPVDLHLVSRAISRHGASRPDLAFVAGTGTG